MPAEWPSPRAVGDNQFLQAELAMISIMPIAQAGLEVLSRAIPASSEPVGARNAGHRFLVNQDPSKENAAGLCSFRARSSARECGHSVRRNVCIRARQAIHPSPPKFGLGRRGSAITGLCACATCHSLSTARRPEGGRTPSQSGSYHRAGTAYVPPSTSRAKERCIRERDG